MVHNSISEICEECTTYVDKLGSSSNTAEIAVLQKAFDKHKERHGIYRA